MINKVNQNKRAFLNKRFFAVLGAILFLTIAGFYGYKWFKQVNPEYGEINKSKGKDDLELQEKELTFYTLDNSGNLTTITSKEKFSEENIQKIINNYVGNTLKAKTSLELKVYSDEDGKHARVNIQDLNFIDFYAAHPEVSKAFPAFLVEGDTINRVPMEIQKRFAESIDKTIKENFGIQFVHWTIGGILEPNDGILYGDVPKKSQETINRTRENGLEVSSKTYFVDPEQSESSKKIEANQNGNIGGSISDTDAKMKQLLEKYPNGDIPADELPY